MDAVEPFSSIGVVGAGAWGTALAELVARNGTSVKIWAREDEVVASINERRENMDVPRLHHQ